MPYLLKESTLNQFSFLLNRHLVPPCSPSSRYLLFTKVWCLSTSNNPWQVLDQTNNTRILEMSLLPLREFWRALVLENCLGDVPTKFMQGEIQCADSFLRSMYSLGFANIKEAAQWTGDLWGCQVASSTRTLAGDHLGVCVMGPLFSARFCCIPWMLS